MSKYFLMVISLLAIAISVPAQRQLVQDYSEVTARATHELDSSMTNGGLKEWAVKNNVKGEYVMDITIHEKGKVLTVFTVSNDSDDINMQTRLKDFVRTLVFSFKMPKGKTYKFQYTFNFN